MQQQNFNFSLSQLELLLVLVGGVELFQLMALLLYYQVYQDHVLAPRCVANAVVVPSYFESCILGVIPLA